MKAIDLFAGAGGFSTGAVQAGCEVLWAANHWPAAIAAHSANHPDTVHLCQDLHQADWTKVPAHDLLLGSPSCQGFSRARGTHQPRHDVARSTAWAVVSAMECHRPPVGLVENVPAFQKWALFPAWSAAMQALGYSVSPHVVDAADCGVPQHRVRLFVVLTKSKAPLILDLPKKPHVAARTVIDFSVGKWSLIDRPGRSAKTLIRVKAGRERFGERFLIAYYGSVKGGRSLDRPIGTLTTCDRYGIVDGARMRMVSIPEAKAFMSFPASYLLPPDHKTALHLLGNAVCPEEARTIIEAIKAAA